MTERYCEGERFADLSFTEETFEDYDFTDCVFVDCSFTKCELDHTTLNECKFVRCEITGLRSTHSSVQSLDFEDCRLNEIDDVGHGAVGHGGGDVAGHGVLQGGLDVGLGQLLLPGAFAVQNVAEALHQDLAVGQHVGQLAHLLGVGDGLVEGLGKVCLLYTSDAADEL